MHKVELNVAVARVVRSVSGPDTIFLMVDLPAATFPFNDSAMVSMSAAAGTGAEYVRTHFGMEPEII